MATRLKIVSFNMRMNNPGDGINAFPNRKGRIKEFIDGSDQSKCPREYVKVFLKHKSIDEPFCVYNVHTDHVGVMAREFASLQILQDMNSHNYKVFFTGDFNANPDAKSIKMIVENSTRPMVDAVGGAITFHNFGNLTDGDKKIDYIFADRDTPIVESGIVADEGIEGVYISDHYPIWAIFEVRDNV